MKRFHNKLHILASTLVLTLLAIASSYVRIEQPCCTISYEKPKIAFSLESGAVDQANTFATFFFPTAHEISTISELLTAQYEVKNYKQSPQIELFSRESIKNFSELVDFKYIPPTDWIAIKIDITEKNNDLYNFSQNLKLTHKYNVCNVVTGDNAFINTKGRIIKAQEKLLTFVAEDTTTKNIKKLDRFLTNNEANSLLIQTEENIFNHNRQLTTNE